MDDSGILALYFARDEQAVAETAEKYGGRCYAVSYQILRSREDAEECVNDTYVKAWNAIPPQRPAFLGAFLLKIARNLALTVYQAARTQKRGGGQGVEVLTQELADCVTGNPEAAVERAELSRLLDQFLRTLPDRRSPALETRIAAAAREMEQLPSPAGQAVVDRLVEQLYGVTPELLS